MKKLIDLFRQFQHLSVGGEWKTLPRKKRSLLAFFRMLWVMVKGLKEDLLVLRASALTYITLISIVPILAVSFSMLKGFGLFNDLEAEIFKNIATLPDASRIKITDFVTKAFDVIGKADYATLGSIGLVIALLSIIKLLGSIEHSFNDIWGIKEHRTFARKFSDYISTVVVIPILFLLSVTVTHALSSNVLVDYFMTTVPDLANLYLWILGFLGHFFTYTALTLLYLFLPNTKVKFWPALVGGVTAGIAWEVVLWIFIEFQVNAASTNAIYGTFVAIPIFLAFTYTNWLVILFGAEVSFAMQHWKTFELNTSTEKLNFKTTLYLATLLTSQIVEAFKEKRRWYPADFSEKEMISIKDIRTVLEILEAHKIVIGVDESNQHYLPGGAIDNYSLGDVVRAIVGEQKINTVHDYSNTPLISASEESRSAYIEIADRFKIGTSGKL
ncbi:MAG: YihY/virulence factor BrkB family protein [Lentisphaeria bacterium]|nr:YihY/virulence factor BrkB family protein [Lentisphaeria bacterium]